MATIKVYTSEGVKELICYDNFDDVDYLDDTGFDDPQIDEVENDYDNPF